MAYGKVLKIIHLLLFIIDGVVDSNSIVYAICSGGHGAAWGVRNIANANTQGHIHTYKYDSI